MVEGKDCISIRVGKVGRWHGALAADIVFERSKPPRAPAKRKRALDLMLALVMVVVVPAAFAVWGLSNHLVPYSILINPSRG